VSPDRHCDRLVWNVLWLDNEKERASMSRHAARASLKDARLGRPNAGPDVIV
jgi:hypothetical protein